jgi:hypothetical protein
VRVEIEVGDLEDLAADLAGWRAKDVIKLVKKIDEHMADWELVLDLKEWVDQEVAKHAREIADDKRAAGKCYQDAETGHIVHQSPHKGCILR